MTAHEAESSVEKILVVRLGAMGDVIHTLPAVQALRDAFPHAMIGWLIEERWADLLSAHGAPRRGPRTPQRPLVEWVHTVDLRAWRQSLFKIPALQQIAKVWNDVRSVGYDVAIDLQGAIRSAVLARVSRAGVVWGAAEPRESPASLLYTRIAIARGAHVIEQNLSVVQAATGAAVHSRQVEFPYDPVAEERIGRELTRQGSGPFVLLNPGAGWGAKRWPAERYGEVARRLSCDGFLPLVNFGPSEESLASEVVHASGNKAKPMKLSISELIALTRKVKLFIGGDTGPMHLAAAVGVPVVAIFGPTDPARNGPSGTRSVVLRNAASPTTHARRTQPDEAMLEISADMVVEAARGLLKSSAEQTHG